MAGSAPARRRQGPARGHSACAHGSGGQGTSPPQAETAPVRDDGKDGPKRRMKVRVKTAKGRTTSQRRWLERQLNDPYVAEAKSRGYRYRAAFKLREIDDKARILKQGAFIVDLGAAPGGWTQVALERVGQKGKVVGIDLQEIVPIPGAELIVGDFLSEEAFRRLEALLDRKVDVVLSDMAASATGHTRTDHLKIMALCEAALDFAETVLVPGGAFLAKVLRGGAENELLNRMKKSFASVSHVKPPASRADSAEMYVLAKGFRGRKEGEGA
ncbi:MAG: RlmE family RNA methyltransferase [Alphaproteobacteria bacterium]|nr:RlmE family RNA methyltransferase [Alphaproteobacteria bacterium]